MDKPMDKVTKDAVKRTSPRNPIIGQARADEWDRKIDGLVLDVDSLEQLAKKTATTAVANQMALDQMRAEIGSAVTWNKIRDVVQLLLLALILGLISFNTSQLWNWN